MSESEKSNIDNKKSGTQHLVAVGLLLCILGWVISSYVGGGIISDLVNPDLSAEDKLEMLRGFFDSWGAFAPLIYVVIVVVEVVVAPIPGTILYLPGGVIFGGFWGGVLSLIGNVIGAGVACAIMRSIVGRQATHPFFSRQSLEKYKNYIEKRGIVIITVLRANPFTSSDIVSYAAGLTTVPVWKVMLGTCIGMTPICFVQSYLAEGIFSALPWLIWPMIVMCVVYAVVVVIVIMRLGREKAQD